MYHSSRNCKPCIRNGRAVGRSQNRGGHVVKWWAQSAPPSGDMVKWSAINWRAPSPCLQRPWDEVCLTDNQRSAFYVPKFKVKPERGHSKTTWTISSVIYDHWTFLNKNVYKNRPSNLHKYLRQILFVNVVFEWPYVRVVFSQGSWLKRRSVVTSKATGF